MGILDRRTAIIDGGGGGIGAGVAQAFAREGAHVHLVGRHLAPLESVARGIAASGGDHWNHDQRDLWAGASMTLEPRRERIVR